MVDASKIKFTKHATEKFDLLKNYGFKVTNEQIIAAILGPERLDSKGTQFLATRTISQHHAIRVV